MARLKYKDGNGNWNDVLSQVNVIQGSGVTSYEDLTNKPSINSVTLSGNKTSSDLGLQDEITNDNKLSADLIESGTNNKVFTAANQVKLSNIEAGAQVNTVNSVNSKTGAVVLNASDVGAINPNLLINGDFRVNQRGQRGQTAGKYEFSDVVAYTRVYTVDRWRFVPQVNNSTSTVTVNSNSISIYCANQYDNLSQFIEDYYKFAGKTVTLSLNVKSKTSNNFVARINVDGEQKTYVTINNTGVLSTSVTLPNSITTSLQVSIVNSLNSASTVEIEYIKLEIGEIATPFSPRPYAEELQMCQRYYEKINLSDTGNKYNINKVARNQWVFYDPLVSFKTTKRVRPTVKVFSSSSGDSNYLYDSTNLQDVAMTIAYITADSFVVRQDSGAMTSNSNFYGYYDADAEIY